MAKSTKFPLEVFYDGGCGVCSREMQLYQRRESGGRLRFIDISAADFNPADHGRSLAEFMRELHVRDAEGDFHTGVNAFARIWSAFPDSPLYSLLEWTIRLPGIKQGADLGYAGFARFRHLFPKTDCRDGQCNIH
jgi:predicted DCC family thiol-disulfide oxidoreductase YuxK